MKKILFSPLGVVLTFFRSGLVDLYGTDLLESGSLNSAFKNTLRYFQTLLQSSIHGILLAPAPRSRKSEITIRAPEPAPTRKRV
jgi:hypothetical protein